MRRYRRGGRYGPQSANAILASRRGNLRELQRQVRFLQQIESAVAAGLPQAAAERIRVADYCDGRLVLMVDSGSWGTRIRYQQQEISRSLARHFRLIVDDLVIRVRTQPRPQPSTLPPRQLSTATRRLLADSGRDMTGNPPLAAALTRLAAAGTSAPGGAFD